MKIALMKRSKIVRGLHFKTKKFNRMGRKIRKNRIRKP